MVETLYRHRVRKEQEKTTAAQEQLDKEMHDKSRNEILLKKLTREKTALNVQNAAVSEELKQVRVQAKKLEKNEDTFETLASRCITVITENFAERPNLEGIPSKFLPQVTARLPLDLDISVSGPHIHDENYWKRACLTRPVSARRRSVLLCNPLVVRV